MGDNYQQYENTLLEFLITADEINGTTQATLPDKVEKKIIIKHLINELKNNCKKLTSKDR